MSKAELILGTEPVTEPGPMTEPDPAPDTDAPGELPGDPSDPAAPQEVELKYAVSDAAAVRAWLESAAVPGVTAGEWSVRADQDTYVDTDDHLLAAAGYSARLRRRGSKITLTLKSRGQVAAPGDAPDDSPVSAALHRRIELNGPATRSSEPRSWPESDARELLLALAGEAPLRIRFVVQQRRAVRILRDEAGGSAELSLDEAKVRYRDAVAGSFTTLEIEALEGSVDLLRRMAAAVEASGLAEPEARSKEVIAAELAHAEMAREAALAEAAPDGGQAAADAVESAVGGDPAAEVDAGAPVSAPKPPKFAGVRADDTLGGAGRKVLRLHLARMLAAEGGTRSGEDMEELHKMRVATRRMRAAWRVFDGAYRPRLQRRYVRELRAVATALGTVRDLDVQRDGLNEYVAALPEPGAAAMEPLVAEWARRREAARAGLLHLLDGKGYAAFVRDYQAFVDTAEAGEPAPVPGRPTLVRDHAAGRIWAAFEAVRAHETTLAWADVPALHALRIDGKRLRYTLEFFREVLPAGADVLIARVTEMQDLLGLLNDADVAAHMTRDYLSANVSRLPAASREAVGFYLASREAELLRLRRLFPGLWRRLVGVPFRRTLAYTVAAL